VASATLHISQGQHYFDIAQLSLGKGTKRPQSVNSFYGLRGFGKYASLATNPVQKSRRSDERHVDDSQKL
jgi:hypothetical protein